MTDPIDGYLDELLSRLRGSSTDVRRILAETEQHLRDAAADAEARGLDPVAAQHEAIARFGSARDLSRRFSRTAGLLLPLPTVAQLVESLALLAAVGLLAIGLSGGLAHVFGTAFGKSFVSGDAPGVTYTAARCADFLEYHPEARTCEGAAVAHHFDEVVWYRLDAGVLGIIALVAFGLVRRYNRRRFGDARALPDGFIGAIGSASFGLAAAGLLFLGLGGVVFGSGRGAGDFLSGGVVAFVVFLFFAGALIRTLRARARGDLNRETG
jgi:hypothetical protein